MTPLANPSSDTPNLFIFPPLIPLFVLVLGVLLNFLVPFHLLIHVAFLVRIVAGAIGLVVGLGMVFSANRLFHRMGTNVQPSQPTVALATTGIFTWTRNPMYVGGILALLGLGTSLALDWVILLLLVSLPLMHYAIVLREERYLERKFGDEYRRYLVDVPRYWWRF